MYMSRKVIKENNCCEEWPNRDSRADMQRAGSPTSQLRWSMLCAPSTTRELERTAPTARFYYHSPRSLSYDLFPCPASSSASHRVRSCPLPTKTLHQNCLYASRKQDIKSCPPEVLSRVSLHIATTSTTLRGTWHFSSRL